MKIALSVWGILASLFGFMELLTAATVMQQIVASLALVASTIAFGAVGTIRAIEGRKASKEAVAP